MNKQAFIQLLFLSLLLIIQTQLLAQPIGTPINTNPTGIIPTPQMNLEKINGTYANPLPVQAGDTLGNISVFGYASGGLLPAANVRAISPNGIQGPTISSDLIFETSDGTMQERMRITSSGNIGIGVQNPDNQLHISGNLKSESMTGSGIRMVVVDSDGTVLASPLSPPAKVWDDSADVIYKLNTRLGLGTKRPDFAMEIKAAGQANKPQLVITEEDINNVPRIGFRFRDSINSHFWAMGGKPGANQSSSKMSFNYSGASGEIMTLTGNGRLGLGTDEPEAKMELRKAFQDSISRFNLLLSNEDPNGGTGMGWLRDTFMFSIETKLVQTINPLIENAANPGSILGFFRPEIDDEVVLGVTSNGRVGVGTSQPSAQMELRKSGVDTTLKYNLFLTNEDPINGAGVGMWIDTMMFSLETKAIIPSGTVSASSSSPTSMIGFFRPEIDDEVVLGVTSNGRVGVGTSQPSAQMELRKSGVDTTLKYNLFLTNEDPINGAGVGMWIDTMMFSLETKAIIPSGPASATSSSPTSMIGFFRPEIDDEVVLGITSNGRVGIGTETPESGFHVAGGEHVLFGKEMSGAGSRMIWNSDRSAFRSGGLDALNGSVWNDTMMIGKFSFSAGFNTNATGTSSFSSGENTFANGYTSVAMGLNTSSNANGSTAMGVNAFTNTERTFVWGSSYLDSNFVAQSAGSFIIGGPAFVNGNILITSDARFKQGIHKLTHSLDNVMLLNGHSYTFKDDYYEDVPLLHSQQIGFLAQEVEEVLPELVHTDQNGNKSVNYQGVIPVLVEAIKELKTQNDELKERLERVEEKQNAGI